MTPTAPTVAALLDTCAERGVPAVQAIKAVARRRWTDEPGPHFSWYQPLADDEAIARAVRFVLGQPGLFLNSSSDALGRPVSDPSASRSTEAWRAC